MITINGKKYSGNNITIDGDIVTIDGAMINGDFGTEPLKIVVEGNLVSLTTDRSVDISGSVTGSVKAGGSVNCDDIGGNVDAGGSVNCGDVDGSIRAGGSVNCGDISGSVTASVVRSAYK